MWSYWPLRASGGVWLLQSRVPIQYAMNDTPLPSFTKVELLAATAADNRSRQPQRRRRQNHHDGQPRRCAGGG